MTRIADASAVFASLVEDGPRGDWARENFEGQDLAAPSLMRYEVLNTLRRHVASGLVTAALVRNAMASFSELPVQEWPLQALAERAWELRDNFTIFDASYIALAEMLDATLVTLDARLARGPGVRCRVAVFGVDT